MGLLLWMPYLNAKKASRQVRTCAELYARAFPQSIAGRAELARYTLTRALITGGNAALTPDCNLVALTGLALRTFPGSAKRKSVILGERNAKHNAPCVRGERICKICVLAENGEAPSWQSCGAAAYRLRRIPTFPHFFTLKSPK